MKQLTFGILLILVLGACAGNDITEKSREMIFPNCTNDFFVIFNESTTFTGSDSTTKVTLEVRSSKLSKKFKLEQGCAASGVKYATKDGKYIFWEHQGEFTFGTEDSTYCLCK